MNYKDNCKYKNFDEMMNDPNGSFEKIKTIIELERISRGKLEMSDERYKQKSRDCWDNYKNGKLKEIRNCFLEIIGGH